MALGRPVEQPVHIVGEQFGDPIRIARPDAAHELRDDGITRHPASATVRMSPIAMKRLMDGMEPVVVHAARTSATRPDADGRVEVVIPIESVDSAITTLLPFGGEAEVLGPPEVRAGMRAAVAALTRVYGWRDREAGVEGW